MGTGAAMRLTAIEESILLWESATVPWNTQYDVSAPHLDPERLRAAFNAALAHHELAACSVQPGPRGGWEWARADEPADVGPVEVVACADDDAVEAVRSRQLNTPIPLDRAPLLRTTVARLPDHDLVLTSVSHVLCDGLGVARLMQSVGRAYLGQPDPTPVALATARRVLTSPLPTTWEAIAKRWATGLSVAGGSAVARSRIAPQGGGDRPGCGVVTRKVDVAEIRAARARRGASFDDYAVAAVHLAIQRWNDDHGLPTGRIGVSLGVNLRAVEWFLDVVANLASFVSVTTDPSQRGSLDAILQAVGPQLALESRFDRARVVADASAASALVPAGVRRAGLTQAPTDRFDSLVMANGGVDLEACSFAEGDSPDIWCSGPAVPAAGLNLSQFVHGGHLRLTVRYDRSRFDAAGAGAFTDCYVAALTGR